MSERKWTSSNWYRVSGLKLRLRSHVLFWRHYFRDSLWYVLQDRTSGRFHRFSPEAYHIISMMNGQNTLDEIWDDACNQLDTDAVTQDEVIQLIGQLHIADVLVGDVPTDILEVSERGRKQKRRKLVMSVLNPLALRLPLIDPDDFLTATLPVVRPLISWFGAVIFLVLMSYSAVLLATHWQELTASVADRVLATENILLILIAYPFIKAFHELGHAYVIKHWGGEVHEIGIMFLVFMPVPYVDASDSIAFPSKWQRALVGGAGILVEMMLAGIALIVWVGAEEGLFRAFAYNIMLIGGISTLLFNGNPLLRFDGYYVLGDLLEIPNLGQRSNRYLGYLILRFGFGVRHANNPTTAKGEPVWFVAYSIAAFVYRLFITFAIAVLVSSKFFIVGTLLAIWASFLMLVLPLLKQIWFLLTSPVLRRKRGRAFMVVGSVVAGMMVVLFAIPLPYATVAQGVIQPVGESAINANSDGVIRKIYVTSGSPVEQGDPLFELEEPLAAARVAFLNARVNELGARVHSQDLINPSEAKKLTEEMVAIEADLALARQRLADLTVRAHRKGTVIISSPDHMHGRFVTRGDTLAHVADFSRPVIRVFVSEADADLVRRKTRSLSVRLAGQPANIFEVRIVRETPALSNTLPSLALATEGGGPFAIDPYGRTPLSAFSKGLVLELEVLEMPQPTTYGTRSYVRFSHGSEPIASRISRKTSQIFLKYFNI